MTTVESVGVVVVGDELLSGKRQDRHLAHVIEVLAVRGMSVAWCRLVGDDPDVLAETLVETQTGERPVLCFGGIGATPDDGTRQAAARAFGRVLVRHPEAAAMIAEQFGREAYPNRIRMADLPEDCLLIPNPCNRIPGFTLYDHHFLPGFPQMAWPMLDWVLARYYPAQGEAAVERSLRVTGVKESDLLGLMETLVAQHPGVKFFSLPRLGAVNTIELGFRGDMEATNQAFADLETALSMRAVSYRLEGVAA